MSKNITTIEELAVMIHDNMASKEDMKGMASKEDVKRLENITATMRDDIRLMQDDIRDIKITLGPLVRIVAGLETDVHNLMARVMRLEKKAGASR